MNVPKDISNLLEGNNPVVQQFLGGLGICKNRIDGLAYFVCDHRGKFAYGCEPRYMKQVLPRFFRALAIGDVFPYRLDFFYVPAGVNDRMTCPLHPSEVPVGQSE